MGVSLRRLLPLHTAMIIHPQYPKYPDGLVPETASVILLSSWVGLKTTTLEKSGLVIDKPMALGYLLPVRV